MPIMPRWPMCLRAAFCQAPKYETLRLGDRSDEINTEDICDENAPKVQRIPTQKVPPTQRMPTQDETAYTRKIIDALDSERYTDVLKIYFGNNAYDWRFADWVVYISSSGNQSVVRQGLIGRDRRFIGKPQSRLTGELFGDQNLWVMVFSTFSLIEATGTGTTATGILPVNIGAPPTPNLDRRDHLTKNDVFISTADPLSLPEKVDAANSKSKSPCPAEMDGGAVRVTLATTQYERGLTERALDSIIRSFSPTKVEDSLRQAVHQDSITVCMVEISSNSTDRLFLGFKKLQLRTNTTNGISLFPVEGQKTFAQTNIREVHTTFGNGEQGRFGLSLALGTPMRVLDQGGGNIQQTRLGGYLFAHWYLYPPNRPWRNGSFSFVIGGSLRDKALDHYVAGFSIGHVFQSAGVIVGSSFNKVDRMYPGRKRTIMWATPFVGLDYAF